MNTANSVFSVEAADNLSDSLNESTAFRKKVLLKSKPQSYGPFLSDSHRIVRVAIGSRSRFDYPSLVEPGK
jgi:hypothetical protein